MLLSYFCNLVSFASRMSTFLSFLAPPPPPSFFFLFFFSLVLIVGVWLIHSLLVWIFVHRLTLQQEQWWITLASALKACLRGPVSGSEHGSHFLPKDETAPAVWSFLLFGKHYAQECNPAVSDPRDFENRGLKSWRKTLGSVEVAAASFFIHPA